MATLKHIETEQTVTVADAEAFLGNVPDADKWAVADSVPRDDFGNPIEPDALVEAPAGKKGRK